MDRLSSAGAVLLVVEGFRAERAGYLFPLLRSFFVQMKILVNRINLENAALSLANPVKETDRYEEECKEMYKQILSMLVSDRENVIFVCDTLTEPYERREAYLGAEYSIETNSVFLLRSRSLPIPRVTLGVSTVGDSMVEDIAERFRKTKHLEEKEGAGSLPEISFFGECQLKPSNTYVERLCVLLGNLRKRIVLYQRTKLSQGIYLYSKYSTLCLLHSGYTLFFSHRTAVLSLVLRILTRATVKKKWSIYFSAFQKTVLGKKKEGVRTQKIEQKYKKELRVFCERERITRIIHPGCEKSRDTTSQVLTVQKIEVPSLDFSPGVEEAVMERELLESLLLIEGFDKVLVLSTVPVIKTLLWHMRREQKEDPRQVSLIPYSVVKISVKGNEITEQKYYITRTE